MQNFLSLCESGDYFPLRTEALKDSHNFEKGPELGLSLNIQAYSSLEKVVGGDQNAASVGLGQTRVVEAKAADRGRLQNGAGIDMSHHWVSAPNRKDRVTVRARCESATVSVL